MFLASREIRVGDFTGPRLGERSVCLLATVISLLCCSNGAGTEGGKTVVDSLKRTVSVPLAAERLISLEPEITRIIVALGGGERLVGIDYFLRHFDHLFPLIFPQSRDLQVLSNEGQDLNFEAALSLKPDVVFSSPSEFMMTEAIEQKLRAPVVALASLGRFDNLLREMMLVGEVLERTERAGELISFFQARIGEIRRVLEDQIAAPLPRVYLAFWGSFLRTPVSYDPVDAAGGLNLAAGLLPSRLGTAAAAVDLEKVLSWNPEVILVQGNYLPAERAITVEGILKDPRLRSVRAVGEKRVHYTFGFWYWWDPALVLLETEYLARVLHPGLFPGFDLERAGNEIFEKFYGVRNAFSELSKILGCHDWIKP